MSKQMYVVAQIGILSFSFLIGLTAWAQEMPSVVGPDDKPASTIRQPGSETNAIMPHTAPLRLFSMTPKRSPQVGRCWFILRPIIPPIKSTR